MRNLLPALTVIILLGSGCRKQAKLQTPSELMTGKWQLIAASSIPYYLKDSITLTDLFPTLSSCSPGYFISFNGDNTGSYNMDCNQFSKTKWSITGDSIVISLQPPDSLIISEKITELNTGILKTSRIIIPANDTPLLIYESYIHR